jgi:Sec-independent protein translocase protein TatA
VDIALLLVVMLIIVLVWRGPKMLPRIGAAFGKTVKGVREHVPGALKDDSSETSESSESGDKSSS